MRLWYKVSGILFDISFMASLNDSESLKYSPNAFKMANVCILVWNYLYHMKKFTLEAHYSKVHIIAKRVLYE